MFTRLIILLFIVLFNCVSSQTETPSEAPSMRPSVAPSFAPTLEPSVGPSVVPSTEPSGVLTLFPTFEPSNPPSLAPTMMVSESPTLMPSYVPTIEPSNCPSMLPTVEPSTAPSSPSIAPTDVPSASPMSLVSESPSTVPTETPTTAPSIAPSNIPTILPTTMPTVSIAPSEVPSIAPTASPSLEPSLAPSEIPTVVPTEAPTVSPTLAPTAYPTSMPTSRPSGQPSGSPTSAPSNPSSQPTGMPSNQPTVNPTQPTGQPSSAPSGDPTTQPTSNPTSPTSRPTSQPSTFLQGPGLGYQEVKGYIVTNLLGTPHIVVYVLNGVFSITSTIATLSYKTEEGMKKARNIRITTGILSLMLTLMFDFTIYCGRFNYLLNRQDTYYPMETEDGRFYWPGPLYYSSTIKTLQNNHCLVSTVSVTQSDGETVDYLYERSATSHACEFMGYWFNAELVKEGEAKFSISIGLMIWFALQIFILFIEFALILHAEEEIQQQVSERSERGEAVSPTTRQRIKNFIDGLADSLKNPVRTSKKIVTMCMKWFAKYIILFIIASQQALVLLPLTGLIANDYCVELFVPQSDKHAVCLYKYAVFSIPYFIYHTLGAIGATFVFQCGLNMMENADRNADRNRGSDAFLGCVVTLVGAGGFVYCVFMMLCFFVYYMFGGIAVGLYYEFSAISFTKIIFVPQSITIGLFLYNDALGYVFGNTAIAANVPKYTNVSAGSGGIEMN